MPRRALVAAWAEHLVDVVGEAPRDVEQPRVPGAARVGDRCLDQVARAVELVIPREVREVLRRLGDLEVGVEVAVLLLGRRDEPDALVGEPRQLLGRRARQLPAERLEPLVEVGVGVPHPHELAVLLARRHPEVVEVPRLLQAAGAIEQQPLVVQALPVCPDAAADLRLERLQERVRGAGDVDGTGQAGAPVASSPARSSRSFSRYAASSPPSRCVPQRLPLCTCGTSSASR